MEQIVALSHPVRVVAFGSRARGDHGRDSDLDLAVIIDRYDPKADKRPLWRADVDVWMDMDVLVYDMEREALMAGSLVSVQAEILREELILYDRQIGFIDGTVAARLAG